MISLTNRLIKWICPTWYKASDLFERPRIKVYFGLWKNDPNLPVWRRGLQIRLAKSIGWGGSNKYKYPAYQVVDRHSVVIGYKTSEVSSKKFSIKKYADAVHKLPGKLRSGDIVWNSKIRKKLKKWHLSWIQPIITLPLWTAFYYCKRDIMWKWKWDDIRYEYPPQLTLVFFGISFSVILLAPKCEQHGSEDTYYECMLNYLYDNSKRKLTLRELVNLGGWSRISDEGKTCYFSLRPEYLLPRYRDEYFRECKRYNKGLKDKFE